MKKILIFMFAAGLLLLGGCTRIVTGSVAIQQGYTGHISEETVGQGLYMSLFTTYIPIDVTMTRAEVDGLQPKDSNGVLLKKVDVVVSYTLNPDLVGKFYRHTKELDPEPDGSYYTLGMNILRTSIIPQAVQHATEESNLNDIASHQMQYAKTIQQNVENLLNTLYPGINPFQIVSVTLPNGVKLPDAIQKQMDDQAGYKAEQDTMAVKMQTIEKRRALAAAEAEANANALATAAKSTGLTPDQIIAWRRAAALEKMADAHPKLLVSTKSH